MKTKLLLGSALALVLTMGCQPQQGADESQSSLSTPQNEPLTQPSSNTASIAKLKQGFLTPEKRYYPETWFHLNGKNISKAGLTADLEAISASGMQGIQLFNKKGPAYPDMPQVAILTPEWEQMIGHVADETDRLGLNLSFQNCPGWSMAGGPWVPAEEAQRELIHHEFAVSGGQLVERALPIQSQYQTQDRNYQDVRVIAFRTPNDHHLYDLTPSEIQSNNQQVPWDTVFGVAKRISYQVRPRKLPAEEPYRSYQINGLYPVDNEPTWVSVKYQNAFTLRSVELPPIRKMFREMQYPKTNIDIQLEAKIQDEWKIVTTMQVPSTHFYDHQYPSTMAIPATTSDQFRFTFLKDPLFLPYLKLNGRTYLHNHESKAAKSSRSLQSDLPQSVHQQALIDSQQVIDISKYMNDKGTLSWQAPAGDWSIVRFGHVNMLRTNKPAEPEATGWETSKLDKEAIENHLRNGMMGNLMREGGPLDGHKVHGMLIDSWESYVPTWTMKSNRLSDEFAKRRGYDMTPYLPAMMGYVVDSVQTSNKFLRDLRETMDDLFVENFFDHFRTVAHDMGSKVYTEGATGETLPGDPLRYYGVSDYPMTEFWYPKAPSNQKEAKPIFAAASAYHLYDKPFLAAEAATHLNVKWNETPNDIQYLINENFAKGINHLVFHTFSHSPHMDKVPGSSFGGRIGFPLLRTQTWWQHTPTWMTSLARAQYLLQQGEFVADVLWYLGDEFDRHPFDTHPFPEGYKFDYLNSELLQSKVKVTDGQLHVEGAGQYQIIMLRDSQNMLLSTAQKLQQLVKQGAVILGNKPLNSPSLMDDEEDLLALKAISDELWGGQKSGSKQVGKGRVYWGVELEHVLEAESIMQDVSTATNADVRWIHRTTSDAEIYYVTNQHDTALDVSVTFRHGAGKVEIWDNQTGSIRDASLVTRAADSNVASVMLQLAPHASQFVVFNKNLAPSHEYQQLKLNQQIVLDSAPNWFRLNDSAKPALTFIEQQIQTNKSGSYSFTSAHQSQKIAVMTEKMDVNQSPWNLTFSAGWDAPESLQLDTLIPLHRHTDTGVRHYSGSVTYQTEFNYDLDHNQRSVRLDLGQVHNIAELWLNGEYIDTRLSAPYEFSLNQHLKQGLNQLKVIVTNTWRNQLIFDNQRAPSNKKTWTTNPPKPSDNILDPSGLVGPVTIFTTANKR